MLSKIASENSPDAALRAQADVIPFPPRLPKPLYRLADSDCRYCVQDTSPREMQTALFCGEPAVDGPYCPTHNRLCLRSVTDADDEALAADVAAGLRPRR